MEKDEIPVVCAEEPVNISNLFKKQVSLHSSCSKPIEYMRGSFSGQLSALDEFQCSHLPKSSFTLWVIRDEFLLLKSTEIPQS